MARKYQYQILVDMLRAAPGNKLSIREIHVQGWLQNVPDAAMKARKKGFNITTEYEKDNKKIAYYQLREEKTGRDFQDEVLHGTPGDQKNIEDFTGKLFPHNHHIENGKCIHKGCDFNVPKEALQQLFPTNPYRE